MKQMDKVLLSRSDTCEVIELIDLFNFQSDNLRLVYLN